MTPFLLSPFPSARLALPPLCSKSICRFACGEHLGERGWAGLIQDRKGLKRQVSSMQHLRQLWVMLLGPWGWLPPALFPPNSLALGQHHSGSAGTLVGMNVPASEASRLLPRVTDAPSGLVSSAMNLPYALRFLNTGLARGAFRRETLLGSGAPETWCELCLYTGESAGGRAGRAAPLAPILWAGWMEMKRLSLPICAHTCSHESPVPTSVPAD